jgi:hypothetical protein
VSSDFKSFGLKIQCISDIKCVDGFKSQAQGGIMSSYGEKPKKGFEEGKAKEARSVGAKPPKKTNKVPKKGYHGKPGHNG